MKILTSYRQWIPRVAIPAGVVSCVLLYFPLIAIQIFKVHWLGLLVLFIVACGPWGKQMLAVHPETESRYPWWAWLAQIVMLQLCLGAVFIGITASCEQMTLLPPTLRQLWLSEGLFPWAFIALMAAGAGYYSYCRREDAYLATVAGVSTDQPALWVILNYIGRLGTFIVYSASLALISLLWANVAGATPIITGFHLTPLLVTLILLGISFTPLYRRHLTRYWGKSIPLIAGLSLWTVFLAVAIWFLNGLLGPITDIVLPPPTLLKHWLNQPGSLLWEIFANSWWLLWTPLIGMTIARISRGYSIRALMAATLGLPLLLSILIGLSGHQSWELSPAMAMIMSIIGLLGLFSLTLLKKALPTFILVYLPQADHYKFRSYRSTFVKISKMAIFFLVLYMPGGITITQFFLFLPTLPLLFILFSRMAIWFTKAVVAR